MYERCSVVQKSTGRQCILDEGHEEKGLDVHSTIIRPTSPFRYIERARMDGRRLPNHRHHRWCVLDLDHTGRCEAHSKPLGYYGTTLHDTMRALMDLPERPRPFSPTAADPCSLRNCQEWCVNVPWHADGCFGEWKKIGDGTFMSRAIASHGHTGVTGCEVKLSEEREAAKQAGFHTKSGKNAMRYQYEVQSRKTCTNLFCQEYGTDHLGGCVAPLAKLVNEQLTRLTPLPERSGPTKQFYGERNYVPEKVALEPVGNSVPVSPAMGLWTYYVDTAQIEKRLVYDYETASQSGTRTGRWSYFDAYNPKGHSLLGMPYGKKEQELWHLKFVLTELAKTLDIESLKKLNTEMVEILQTEMTRAEKKAQAAQDDLIDGAATKYKYQWSFGVVRPRTPQTPSTDGAVVGTDGLMYELPSQVGYCYTKWHTIEPHEMNNNCQGWQPKKKSIGSFLSMSR